MNKQLALVGLSAISLAISGCGHKATGQSVAVVNGEEVSIGELNDELAAANLPPTVDKKAASAQILQNVVDRRLLVQKAVADGLDKSPEFISKMRRVRDDMLISMLSNRQSGSAKLPTPAEIDAFIAANPQMFAQRSIWSLDQIQFDIPKDKAVLAKLKDTHSLDQIAGVLSASGIAFNKAQQKVDSGTLPLAMVKRVDALPAGEPFILPVNGKAFANVITNRQPTTVPADDQRKIALQMVRRNKATDALQAQLNTLKASAKIEYQKGYELSAVKPQANKPAN
jgi:peptidyl-prolyl cis-trans isomerase C